MEESTNVSFNGKILRGIDFGGHVLSLGGLD
jgi:hypothetical protein